MAISCSVYGALHPRFEPRNAVKVLKEIFNRESRRGPRLTRRGPKAKEPERKDSYESFLSGSFALGPRRVSRGPRRDSRLKISFRTLTAFRGSNRGCSAPYTEQEIANCLMIFRPLFEFIKFAMSPCRDVKNVRLSQKTKKSRMITLYSGSLGSGVDEERS